MRAHLFLLAALPAVLLGTACGNPNPHGEPDGGADGGSLPHGDGGTAQVSFSIHSGEEVQTISPYIYGSNVVGWGGMSSELGLVRLGGNRWSGYNWENNASHAGTDYNNQNDAYLCNTTGCNTPGEAVRRRVSAAHAAGASALVTVPLLDVVAADKNGGGDISQTSNWQEVRLVRSVARKGSSLSLTPDLTDGTVYQDEFVHWVESTFPSARSDAARTIFYSLDNEPDLWPDTHPRLHPSRPTYAEMVSRTRAIASVIKAQAPGALVFGPVSYGWAGYVDLQGAPDAAGRDFLNFYLASMRQAEEELGQRLVDVLDLHWYPEARGDGVRITSTTSGTGAAARMQAPRSLWDPTYVETSWITSCCSGGAIRLIPRMKEKIAAHYPGTRLAFTEYDYGGGQHISGAIAQADVLGIFGREGVFAATHWPLSSSEPFTQAAFRMYRNYDGQGGRFGDTSIRATTSDAANTSVYASVDAGHPGRMVVVAINKGSSAVTTSFTITHTTAFSRAAVYTLTSASASPQAQSAVTLTDTNVLRYTLPASSVTTFVLTP